MGTKNKKHESSTTNSVVPHNYYGFNSSSWCSVYANSLEEAGKMISSSLKIPANRLTIKEASCVYQDPE